MTNGTQKTDDGNPTEGSDPSTGTSQSNEPEEPQGSQGSSGQAGEPEGSPSQTTQGTQAGQGSSEGGSQSPFTHPDLKGRDPREVEHLYETAKQAVREQGARLNQLEREGTRPQPNDENPPSGGRQGEFTEDDFWSDPVGTISQVVRSEMESQVRPMREDVEQSRVQTAKQQLRERFPDFERLEPEIDNLAAQLGIGRPNAQTLEYLYYTAKGRRSAQGLDSPTQRDDMSRNDNDRGQPPQQVQDAQRGQGQGQQGRPSTPPPQQRPSSAPLPRSPNADQGTRNLTESEKRMAREFGFTKSDGSIDAEEFIRWQDMTPQEVVSSER